MTEMRWLRSFHWMIGVVVLLQLSHIAGVSAWTSPVRILGTDIRISRKDSLWILHAKKKGGTNPKKADSGQGGSTAAFDISNNPYYDRFAAFLAEEIGSRDPTKVRKIVEQHPNILTFPERNLKEKFDLLRDLFDFSDDELCNIVSRSANIFSRNTTLLKRKLIKISQILWLDSDMDTVGVIVVKYPSILTMDIDINIAPKVEFLRGRIFHNDNKALIGALIKYPLVLGMSLDNRIIPRSEACLSDGLSPSDHFGVCYLYSNENFKAWFQKNTGRSLTDDWCRDSKLSTQSSEDRAQERIKLLSSKLQMTTEEASAVLENWPDIQKLNLNNLEKKLYGLTEIYGGFKQHAKHAIQNYPQLLTCSLENNLLPKTAYFRDFVYLGDTDGFFVAVTTFPKLFGYSLENRIKPRIEEVQAAGLDPKNLSVSNMLIQKDERFSVWLENKEKKLQQTMRRED